MLAKFLLFILHNINCKGETKIFFESQYDPLVHNVSKTPESKAKALSEITGFFSDHDNHIPSSIETFGDVSILSINLYKEILITDKIEEEMNELISLMDHIHPSIVAIQGISKEELTYLSQYIDSEEHYAIKNTEKGLKDFITGSNTYLPIIYDERFFSIEKADYFVTNEKLPQPFASYLVIKDKRVPNAKVAFTFVNMDLFSSFGEVVSAEFFEIIDDAANAKDIKDAPIFLVGTIGTLPNNVKEAIDLSYVDLIKKDKNNQKLSKTTEHSKNNDDNIERSFILLKDPKNDFKVNYARILSEYKTGDHYPLHAILTLEHPVKGLEDAKKIITGETNDNKAKTEQKTEAEQEKQKNNVQPEEQKTETEPEKQKSNVQPEKQKNNVNTTGTNKEPKQDKNPINLKVMPNSQNTNPNEKQPIKP